MPGSKSELGSDLTKVDATTEEEIARHMIEDDTPEWTDEQLAEGLGVRIIRPRHDRHGDAQGGPTPQ